MTLRKATILFICLGTLVLVCVISLATHFIINASFSDLERDHARQNIGRARNAMSQELSSLDEILVDWAVWDDSKKFMQGHAKDFVESNLNDRTLASLRLTAIVFMSRSGRMVWSQGFDPVQGMQAPLPEGLTKHLQPGSPLLYAANVEDRVKGFLLLPQGLMLVASCPVTGSDGLGPPVGTLVMLRALNAQESSAIAERVRLPLSIERADAAIDADIAPLARDLTGGMLTGPVSADLYCAVLYLPDIWGEPALRLVLRDTREIMNRGDHAMNMALVWMILGPLVCFAVLLAYLERNVLRRLARLRDQVEAIGTDAAAPADAADAADGPLAKLALGRVEMSGSDELSALALRINGTLAELERSRENLAKQCVITQGQEQYLQKVLDSIRAGVILVDPKTRIIREANAFAAALAGRAREDIVGRVCNWFIYPNADDKCPLTDQKQSSEQTVRNLIRADGSMLPILKSDSVIERSGQPMLLETFIEVESLQKAQEALKRSEETYRTVFMNTGTATILIEADTTIRLINQEFEKLSGYTRQEVEGRLRWTEFFHPEDVEWMLQYHVKRRQSADLAPRNYESRFINRRGDTRITLLTVGMIPNTEVSVASIEDITERKQAEEQLRHQAFHDGLTGLPNRQLLQDRLERAIEAARREDHELAVLLMDLDRFKDVNDALGHSAGDRLLKMVATRLKDSVRRSDTVARLGGDEFVLVAYGPAGRDAGNLVARHVLNSFAQPFDLDGRSLHVRFSVGVALFPEHGETPELLMKNADLAMYHAKAAGRNTFAFFSKELNDQVVRRLAAEAGLRRALTSGGLEVFYQPKVSQPGNVITGAEALVRLRREDGSLVSPADFISVAENTGLIMPLSDFVLREACRTLQGWRKSTPLAADLVMSVNLSPRQFSDSTLVEAIKMVLTETNLPPKALKLEITESAIMDNAASAAEKLRKLKALGMALSIDDFGTGYSSMSSLQQFPMDTLKIDLSFVQRMDAGPEGLEIVKAIISLAHSLQLQVIAEGVEREPQRDLLRGLACEFAQGYLFARPLPSQQAWDYLMANAPQAAAQQQPRPRL